MLSEALLLELLNRIYAAATDPQLWPMFLEGFADAVEGTTTCIVYGEPKRMQARVESWVRGDPAYRSAWETHYSKVSPLKGEWFSRFRGASANAMVTSDELIEPSALKKTEFYNDYLLPQNTVHHCGGAVLMNAESFSAFSCFRPRNKSPFGSKEIELLRLLFPHLQRALQIHRQLSQHRHELTASLQALDALATGVAFLDADGKILSLNRAARRAVNGKDGLRIDGFALTASRSEQSRRLRKLIASAALTGKKEGTSAGGELAIDRPSGKRSFSLLVTPAAAGTLPPDAGTPAVIVFIKDPEEQIKMSPEILSGLFGLTGAESRLAELLASGESLVRAGDRLGITHGTARTHLKRMFNKTGTHHQADFVRLLLSAAGHLRGEAE